MAPRRRTIAAMEAECAAFNEKHPVGSIVEVAPGTTDGRWLRATVNYPAQVMSGHTPVVYVRDGARGSIALSHVRPMVEASA